MITDCIYASCFKDYRILCILFLSGIVKFASNERFEGYIKCVQKLDWLLLVCVWGVWGLSWFINFCSDYQSFLLYRLALISSPLFLVL